MNGEVIRDGWRDEHIKEALDLCLACKGCKGDCPVNVDMATYKAEFLAHYWEGRIRPISAYAFGWIDRWCAAGGAGPGIRKSIYAIAGVEERGQDARAHSAAEADSRVCTAKFPAWFRKHRAAHRAGTKVVLWADTFNNYFMPETAQAAVTVLEDAGCDVHVLQQHLCCGRPLYDYGFLDMAKSYLHRNLDALAPYIEAGTPIVVLEPSCCSVFRDEMHNLIPESREARRLAENTFTLAEFLEKKLPGYRPPRLDGKAIVQGHCHHKAVMRMKEDRTVLEKVGLDYKVLESGCCGMAGSFGYEKDKYDISIACGERSLLPEVRKTGVSTIVMADGFSCKEQIAQETNRHALHLAEVLEMAIKPEKHSTMYPERKFIEPRIAALKKSMITAALVVGAVALGTTGLIWACRRTH